MVYKLIKIVPVLLLMLSSKVIYAKDPRIPLTESVKLSKQEKNDIIATINTLTGKSKLCVRDFIGTYQKQVYEYCVATGYAKNDYGGCRLEVGFAVHAGVLSTALQKCNIRWQFKKYD